MSVRQTSAPHTHTHFASLSPAPTYVYIYIYLKSLYCQQCVLQFVAHVLCVECAQLSCGCPSIRSCYQSFSLIIYLLLFVVANSALHLDRYLKYMFRAPNSNTWTDCDLWCLSIADATDSIKFRKKRKRFERLSGNPKIWKHKIQREMFDRVMLPNRLFPAEVNEWSKLIVYVCVCITLRIHVRPTREK